MSWGDAFTGVGVLIALAALLFTYRVSRRQTELAQQQTDVQARLTAIEEGRRAEELDARQRALVRADIGRGVLMLTNSGQALAREVRCAVTSLEEGVQPATIFGLEQLPVDLQPRQSMTFDYAKALGEAGLVRVVVTWIDDAGEHEVPHTLRML
jgi:hypothetical protein